MYESISLYNKETADLLKRSQIINALHYSLSVTRGFSFPKKAWQLFSRARGWESLACQKNNW